MNERSKSDRTDVQLVTDVFHRDNDQPRQRTGDGIKDRTASKLTLQCSPNVSIETMNNQERNKALDESWEHDCTYFSLDTDAPIETTIYPKRNKGCME